VEAARAELVGKLEYVPTDVTDAEAAQGSPTPLTPSLRTWARPWGAWTCSPSSARTAHGHWLDGSADPICVRLRGACRGGLRGGRRV